MATKTSAAVGTAAQFMPQPDSDYQARLQGVQGVRGQAPKDTQEGMIADSLGGALSAYLDFSEKQDRRFEAQMAEAAENMVNAATREDVERLTSVEIAQKYGYGTLVDNPYFEAMVSKMRGVRLMSTADADYNQLYGDNQAESMEAEQQRYEEFMSQKRDDYLQHSPSMNFTAFDAGFYSKKSESIARLMSNRSERDVADRLTEVVATTDTQLNDLLYNAPAIGKAGVIEQGKTLFNHYRLSNASPEARYKLASNFIIGIANTGLYSFEDLTEIADNIMVDTRLDGTEVPLSSIVGIQDMADMVNEYHKNHVTKEGLDIIKAHENDPDMSIYDNLIIKERESGNPEKVRHSGFLEAMRSQVEQAQRKKQAERQARMKMLNKQGTAQAKAAAHRRIIRENFSLIGQSNATDAFGNREGVMYDADGNRISDDEIFAEWQAYYQEVQSDQNLSDEERLNKLAQLAGYKGVSSFVSDFQKRVMNNMRQLDLDALDNGIVEGTYLNMYNMYQVNPQQFASAYGADMAQAMRQVRRLADNSGENGTNAVARGLWHWVQVERLPQEQKQQAKNQYSSWVSEMRRSNALPVISDVSNLSNGGTKNITADELYNSSTYDELVTWYIASGMSPSDAATEAGKDIQDNWMFKWGGLLPKTLFYDFYPAADSASNALYLGNKAINSIAAGAFQDWSISSSTYDETRLKLSYFSGEGLIVITDTYTGNTKQITRADLANQMAWLATQPEVTDINAMPAQRTAPNSPNAYAGDWWSNPNYRRFL